MHKISVAEDEKGDDYSMMKEEEMDMDEEVRKALMESMDDWDGGSEPKKAKKSDADKEEKE